MTATLAPPGREPAAARAWVLIVAGDLGRAHALGSAAAIAGFDPVRARDDDDVRAALPDLDPPAAMVVDADSVGPDVRDRLAALRAPGGPWQAVPLVSTADHSPPAVAAALIRLRDPAPARPGPPAGEPAAARAARPAVAARPQPAGRRRTAPPRIGSADLAAGAGLVAGVLLWVVGLAGVDPEAMTDTGLVSVLPPLAYMALGCLVAGFAAAVVQPRFRGWLALAHSGVLVALVHGTPALLYGTLRYSWAWKHVGIIDYIARTGAVDPDIATLGVYHSWPGFFAANALIVQAGGAPGVLSYASWAPVLWNLLFLGAVVMIARALTDDGRTVALTAWCFALANWVGQDYFAPQALAFFAYAVVLAVVLTWFRRPASAAPWLPAARPGQRSGLMVVVVLLVALIVAVHQLTPVVTVLALLGLSVLGFTSARWLPAIAAVLLGTWLLYVADPFVAPNLAELIASLGAVDDNVSDTLVDYGVVSPGQVLVSLAARGLSVGVLLLAGLGALRAWRAGRRHLVVAVLVGAPAGLVLLTSYGSEVLFRVFLFALPFLAFLVAELLRPARRRVIAGLAVAGVSAGLLGGLLLSYYGNEQKYFFTDGEVAAVTFLAEDAPTGSLLVEGSRNYPSQFRNYERFTYVPIAREPVEAREEILADPSGVLERWTTDDAYPASYVLITRGQKLETDAMGTLPPGGLQRIEDALAGSPAFTVLYRNPDAVIFVPSEAERAGGAAATAADGEHPAAGLPSWLVLLVLIAPGIAWVPLLRVWSAVAVVTLAAAVSLAVVVAVAQLLLAFGAWSPSTGIALIAGAALVGFLAQAARAGRRRGPA